MIMVFWHSERVINMDALPVGKTHLQCIHQDAERTLEACWWVGITRVQQKSDLSLTVQACTQIWRLGETITKFGFTLLPPSTLQPWSSTLRFPSVWSPKGCSPQYKVWDWWWWWCDSCSENFAT